MIHTRNGRRRQADWSNHIDTAIFDLMNGNIPEMLQKSIVQTKPLSNIIKRENSFVIEMAVPGIGKDQININVDKDQLVVSAEVEHKLKEGETYSKNEFNYNKFERKFDLGDMIDQKKIEAKFENGLLIITLHVKEEKDTTIKVDIQ